MMKKLRQNKWIMVGSVIVLLIAALFFVRQIGRNVNAQPLQTGDIVEVFQGDLSANATASGKVQAQPEA